MTLYQEILNASKQIDQLFDSQVMDTPEIKFTIPESHPRAQVIDSYFYSSKSLNKLEASDKTIFIVDENIFQLNFVKNFLTSKNVITLPAIEGKVKTLDFLNELISKHKISSENLLVGVGGGLICNCTAYIAESSNSDYILFPSTVLAMADGALGGKVRVNRVSESKFEKHYHKSFYEPSSVYFDPRFLESLPLELKRIGFVEVIKHSLFQSPQLYQFILDQKVKILENNNSLKKAIFWAAYLKKVCLDIDPNELSDGSEMILRAGHKHSDLIEEKNQLTIPHGLAVAQGIIEQLTEENNTELLEKAKKIFTILEIPF